MGKAAGFAVQSWEGTCSESSFPRPKGTIPDKLSDAEAHFGQVYVTAPAHWRLWVLCWGVERLQPQCPEHPRPSPLFPTPSSHCSSQGPSLPHSGMKQLVADGSQHPHSAAPHAHPHSRYTSQRIHLPKESKGKGKHKIRTNVAIVQSFYQAFAATLSPRGQGEVNKYCNNF